jgi:hypothetical protein
MSMVIFKANRQMPPMWESICDSEGVSRGDCAAITSMTVFCYQAQLMEKTLQVLVAEKGSS